MHPTHRRYVKTSRERPKSAPYLRLKKTRKPLFLQLETTKALKKLKIEKKSEFFRCLQMVDYQSVQMFAFQFARRTFALESLSRSLSERILSYTIRADQCAQNVGAIGNATITVTKLCTNNRIVFESLRV